MFDGLYTSLYTRLWGDLINQENNLRVYDVILRAGSKVKDWYIKCLVYAAKNQDDEVLHGI